MLVSSARASRILVRTGFRGDVASVTAASLVTSSTARSVVSVRCWVSFPWRARGLMLARDASITNAWS